MAGKLIESLQTDMSTRVYRVTNGFNEALYLTANEPSLGMYRLQEHIQLTIPKVVEQKQALAQVCQRVEGVCYDLEYNTQAIQSMSKVSEFPHISSLLVKAVELKMRLSEVSRPDSSIHRGQGTEWTSSSLLPSSHVHSHTNSEPSTPVTGVSSHDDDELKPKRFD